MKKFLILALVLLNSLTAFASFPDVDPDTEYARAVNFLQERGVISGYPDGTFGPERTLSRAELLKILIEAVGVSDEQLAPYFNQKCFEDVVAGQWFTKYVCYSKDKGFVVGYENGRFFRPAQDVTVVEAIKMTLAVFGYDFSENEGDVWYVGVVNAAADSHLIPPDVSGFNTPMRREQMAELATRAVKDSEGTLDDHLEDSSDRDEPVDFEEIEERLDRFAFYPAVAIYEFFGDDYKNRFALHFIPDALASEIDDPELTYFTTLDDYFVREGESIGVYSDSNFIDEDRIADTFGLIDMEVADGECLYIDIYDFSLVFPKNFGLQEVLGDFDLAYFKSIGMVSQRTESMNFVNKNVCVGSEGSEGDGLGGRKIILEGQDPDAPNAQEALDFLEGRLDEWITRGDPSQGVIDYYRDYFGTIDLNGLSSEQIEDIENKFDILQGIYDSNNQWNP